MGSEVAWIVFYRQYLKSLSVGLWVHYFCCANFSHYTCTRSCLRWHIMFLCFMCSLSSKIKALASSGSAMFSHAPLPALYNTRLYNNSSHQRRARLVVRANSVSFLLDSFFFQVKYICVYIFLVCLCDWQIF